MSDTTPHQSHPPSGRGRPMEWSDADRRLLTEEWRAGEPARKIAMLLGRTRNSIIGMARRMGLSAHANSPETAPGKRKIFDPAFIGAVQRAINRGETITDISRRHNCGYKTIKNIANQIETTPHGPSLADLSSTQCRWPIGEGVEDPRFGFCAHPVAASELPYCATHMASAYRRAR